MYLHQSQSYLNYIQKLGWQIVEIDGQAIFLKHIPFLGNLAKLQRPTKLPKQDKLVEFVKKYKITRLAIEPEFSASQLTFTRLINQLQSHVHLNTSPFLPTKTILIDLTPPSEVIFNKFNEAKRRAVRRAHKNSLIIKESVNIEDLIKIKNKSAGFLGFITTYGVREIWQTFSPDNAAILLAYKPIHNYALRVSREALTKWENPKSELIAGILLIFHALTAYYWIAASTREGKKLFAPSLLVWESLKLNKARGMKKFDFVGVWDERLPSQNKAWLGFTKFKSGFGGTDIYYPLPELSRSPANHKK